MKTIRLQIAIFAGLFALSFALLAQEPDAETVEIWQKVRKSLFETAPIENAADAVIKLEAPFRAEDAATVPIAIRAQVPQSKSRYIDKVWLLVDKNPSPIAAVFQFTPDSGRADIETRIRIEEYTHIRAVAQMNDGKLYASTRYVRAAGGCSAPAGKDAQAAMANVGKMRLTVNGDITPGKPTLAQLMVSHPNFSGLAMDQLTRNFTPAYYVRKVDVTYGNKLVMSADIDFSISENPNFRFYFVPDGSGELQAKVVDTKDLTFASKTQVTVGEAVRQSAKKSTY